MILIDRGFVSCCKSEMYNIIARFECFVFTTLDPCLKRALKRYAAGLCNAYKSQRKIGTVAHAIQLLEGVFSTRDVFVDCKIFYSGKLPRGVRFCVYLFLRKGSEDLAVPNENKPITLQV